MTPEPMIVRLPVAGEGTRGWDSEVPLMASPAWLKAFPNTAVVYGVFDGDELQAVFVLQEGRRMTVRLVTNPDLSPHCGLTFREYQGNTEKQNGWRKRVMSAIAEYLDRPIWGLISVVFPDWATDLQPFVWRGFKVLVRYTYQIRLSGRTDDDLLAEMSSTRRTQIRNGHKKDLTVSPCAELSIVERLVTRTFHRQGVSHDSSKTHALLDVFAQPTNSFAYVTHKGEMPVAACFCIHDAKRAYYILGGVDEENGVAASAPMAMFACVRHARDIGLEVYDFEGSMVPGIEQYFRSFGGTLTPLYRVVKASLPIEMALKPIKRSLF